MIVHQNRHRKPLHPLSHQWHEVEARREIEASEAEVRLAEFFDNRAGNIWKVLVRDHLVSIGILLDVNFTKQKRDVKPGACVQSRLISLTNNQIKGPQRATIHKKEEKATTNTLQLLWRLYLNWVVSRKTQSHQNFRKAWGIGETRWSFGINSTSTIHTVCATSSKYPSKERTIVWKKRSKFLISEVPTLWNLRTDLKKRLKDKSDAPEARHGILPKHLQAQRKGQSFILFAYKMSGLCRPRPP